MIEKSSSSTSFAGEDKPLLSSDNKTPQYNDLLTVESGSHNGTTATTPDEQLHNSMTSALTTIVEDVQDAAVYVADAIVHEVEDIAEVIVHEAVETETFFLDMGLTRGLSILPSDVVDASAAEECHEETFLTSAATSDHPQLQHHRTDTETTFQSADSTDEEEPSPTAVSNGEKQVYDSSSNNVPVGAYILLASAVVALSSIGPLLNLQGNVNSTLKIAWRKSATIVCISPMAVRALYRDGFPHLTTGQWRMLILVAACYAAMCVLFAWSLDYTTVGNAVMISNSQALILLIGKVLMGDHISLLEGGGALVALTGALFCSGDSADKAEAGTNTLLGDLYAMLSALAGVGYLVFAKQVRPAMELSVFTVFVMTLGLIETIFFLYLAAVPFSWDFNANQGVFGWMNFQVDRLPVELMMALVCNLLGAIGYVRAMQYFSSLVISVAALMEPVVAEIMAVLIGVGILPGWKGWFGNGLVVIGTMAVVYRPPGTKKIPDSHM